LSPERWWIPFLLFASACASVPAAPSLDKKSKHVRHPFPESDVYMELPTGRDENRPYDVMGWVRSKAYWPTADQDGYSEGLCRNYFNKGARQLLKEARKVGADAVIQVRSVVFMLDGKVEEFPRPECSDDGVEGEVLLRGIAIKFKSLPKQKASGP
jgi:hypothetical protein